LEVNRPGPHAAALPGERRREGGRGEGGKDHITIGEKKRWTRILIGLFGDNPPNPDELKLVLRTEMFVVERLIPRPLFRSSIFLGTEPGI
jgi:hypothetical protein